MSDRARAGFGTGADTFLAVPGPLVVDITVLRDRALIVEYDDGVVCEFPLHELRAACPCAECRGKRERSESLEPPSGRSGELRIDDAELTGAWGLSITWNDGHATGIYPWDSLRRWYDGATDAIAVEE